MSRTAKFILLRLLPALVLALVPAAQLTDLGAGLFFWHRVNAGCDCFSKKMILSQLAFQSNLDAVRLSFVACYGLLVVLLVNFRWTRGRFGAALLGLFMAIIAWIAYGNQPYTHEYYLRWSMIPIEKITGGAWGDLAEVWVKPLTTYRFVWACGSFAAVMLAWEAIRLVFLQQGPVQTAPGIDSETNAGVTDEASEPASG